MSRCVDRLQSIRHSTKSWLMYHTPYSPVRYLCVDMWLVCLLQAFVLSHMASAASNFTELLSHWSQELVIRHWRKTENIGVLPSDFCENFTSRHTDTLCQPGERLVSIQAEMKVKKKIYSPMGVPEPQNFMAQCLTDLTSNKNFVIIRYGSPLHFSYDWTTESKW